MVCTWLLHDSFLKSDTQVLVPFLHHQNSTIQVVMVFLSHALYMEPPRSHVVSRATLILLARLHKLIEEGSLSDRSFSPATVWTWPAFNLKVVNIHRSNSFFQWITI